MGSLWRNLRLLKKISSSPFQMVDCEAYTKAQLVELAEGQGIEVPGKIKRGRKAELCRYVSELLGIDRGVLSGVIPSPETLTSHRRDLFYAFRWRLGDVPEGAFRLLNPGTNEEKEVPYTEEELNTSVFYGRNLLRLRQILEEDSETEAILDTRLTEKSLVVGEEGKNLILRDFLGALNKVYQRENSLPEFVEAGKFLSPQDPEKIEEIGNNLLADGESLTIERLFPYEKPILRGPLIYDSTSQSYILYIFYVPV